MVKIHKRKEYNVKRSVSNEEVGRDLVKKIRQIIIRLYL
jgi:hypothetical protein